MTTSRKPIVLVLIDHYLPGYRGGGPVRSTMNFVDALGDDFDLFILTTNRDLGDGKPYPGITTGVWSKVGKAQICYLSPQQARLSGLRSRLQETPYDLLYINGVFSNSSVYVVFLRWLHWIPRRPLIIAPRGHLGAGSLHIKSQKKQIYLTLARALGLYRGVIWHAASTEESAGIRAVFPGENPQITMIPNLPRAISEQTIHAQDEKKPGQASIVFLSRIVPIKNLEFMLSSLRDVRGEVAVDLWGPIEDAAYWEQCQAVIASLPSSIRVEQRGLAEPEQVVDILSRYHLFYLPTLHENFGHVIFEALSAGCPVLISDRTPWNQLEADGVGWSLPLDDPDRFCAAVQQIVDMDADEMAAWSQRARAYAAAYVQNSSAVEQTRQFLLDAAQPMMRAEPETHPD